MTAPQAVDTRALLEEAAREHAEAVRELTAARAEWERLKPTWEAACDRRNEAKREVERIEQAMGAIRRDHMVRVALGEAGIEYDGPTVVAQPVYRDAYLHYLEAVGPEGTGLYVFRPAKSARYLSKQHAILIEHARRQGQDEPPGPVNGQTIIQPSGFAEAAGAWVWEARGSGPWGAGSGAMKPLAPPEGGRWRWLKVREQEELTA